MSRWGWWASAAARMQERPEAAISAELTAIESVERRTDDRRVRYAAVVDRGMTGKPIW